MITLFRILLSLATFAIGAFFLAIAIWRSDIYANLPNPGMALGGLLLIGVSAIFAATLFVSVSDTHP